MRFILATWEGYVPDQQEAKSSTYHLRHVEKAEDIGGNFGQRVYNWLWGLRIEGDQLAISCLLLVDAICERVPAIRFDVE